MQVSYTYFVNIVHTSFLLFLPSPSSLISYIIVADYNDQPPNFSAASLTPTVSISEVRMVV